PETLQNLVNEVLLNVDGTTTFITSITLAGAGDGHTFVVIIETAAGTDVEFGGLFGTAGGLQATQVRCYMGGSPEAFLAAKTAAGEPAPFASVPFGIVDEQLAGGAKGQVFMGMTVFSSNAQGVGLSEPRARGIISVNQAIAGGTTILTFDSIANANGFALADAGQTLQYTGQRASPSTRRAQTTSRCRSFRTRSAPRPFWPMPSRIRLPENSTTCPCSASRRSLRSMRRFRSSGFRSLPAARASCARQRSASVCSRRARGLSPIQSVR